MMPKHLLLITYTIYPPEAELEQIVQTLERADSYELDETAWLIYTEDTARWWYSNLERYLLEDDELMVLQIDIHDFISDPGLEEDLRHWLKARELV